ncbi:helix-turn-helix transcriptional regulator [Pseudomonas sp. BN515]|uniref:helix-turn-helix transcriptional regulator n=1 Tax=Pseudomonas sp. BN515 TaxID=2567892 RepID=UPI002455051F|nr:helix-turn-helix transcriptional regulator [Pseudomonas sp. BN515]MDH4870319.1 helix-turn-helix transcriptional regulator [Pseudomonas sp. BN515]
MPHMDELYDSLVNLCYECVLDGGAWRPMLELLTAATGHQLGAMLFLDQHKKRPQVTSINLCDPACVEVYNAYYHQLDPAKDVLVPRPVGSWYHDLEDLGPQRIHRDPYYQEFHLPFGMSNISCIKLHEQAESGVYLSLLTAVGAALPEMRQRDLLMRLSPHLVRAAKMSNHLQNLELEVAHRDLLLERHPAPLWLLDAEGRVRYCNRQAEQRLSHPAFALKGLQGRLHGKTLDGRLQALIHQAAGQDGKRRAGWLPLPGEAQGRLLVTPVPESSPLSARHTGPLVLLTLLEGQAGSRWLADLFQFSPAEQRLANLLVQGLAPEACAERLNVSINTIRTQLRALFRKTETERQAELVTLLARLQGL